jgi:hypothetical protein
MNKKEYIKTLTENADDKHAAQRKYYALNKNNPEYKRKQAIRYHRYINKKRVEKGLPPYNGKY